jgi:hypothetical protein
MFGGGQPGGRIEYRGDLPAPVTTYASALPTTPLTSRQYNPPSTNRTKSAVVDRKPRRGGHMFFYSHGAVPMLTPIREDSNSQGLVPISMFQRFNIALMDWQKNLSWYESGYPRNLGLSTRVPQLQTNVTGGPGRSSMDQRPLFTKVQTVQRARIKVSAYQTVAARG